MLHCLKTVYNDINFNSVVLCASTVKLCETKINYTEKHGEATEKHGENPILDSQYS